MEQVAENATMIANQLKSDVKLTPTNPEEDIVKSKAKIKIEDIPIEDKIETMKELNKVIRPNPAKKNADFLFSYPPTNDTHNPPNIPPVNGPKTDALPYNGKNLVVFSSSGIFKSSIT